MQSASLVFALRKNPFPNNASAQRPEFHNDLCHFRYHFSVKFSGGIFSLGFSVRSRCRLSASDVNVASIERRWRAGPGGHNDISESFALQFMPLVERLIKNFGALIYAARRSGAVITLDAFDADACCLPAPRSTAAAARNSFRKMVDKSVERLPLIASMFIEHSLNGIILHFQRGRTFHRLAFSRDKIYILCS